MRRYRIYNKHAKQYDYVLRINQQGLVYENIYGDELGVYEFEKIVAVEFSTGLKDIDGEMIFQGDKVAVGNTEGVIEWDKGCFYVVYTEQNGRKRHTELSEFLCPTDYCDIKVIGNIWGANYDKDKIIL